jgi:hypothetical protein
MVAQALDVQAVTMASQAMDVQVVAMQAKRFHHCRHVGGDCQVDVMVTSPMSELGNYMQDFVGNQTPCFCM